MENQESILQQFGLDFFGSENLRASSKWSKFIGIVFIIMGILMFLGLVSILTNIEFLIATISSQLDMSTDVMNFLNGSGKYMFFILFFIFIAVYILNGIFLIKFRSHSEEYFMNGSEQAFENSFKSINKYFIITTVLGIISAISSLVIIVATISR